MQSREANLISRPEAIQLPGIAITSGPVPVVVIATAAVAILWLVAIRSRRHVITVGIAAGIALIVYLTVSRLLVALSILPEPLPGTVCFWIAVGMFALILAVPRLRRAKSWRTRLISIIAVGSVVLGAANGVNREFDAYPTLASLVESDEVDAASPDEFDAHGIQIVDLPDWRPPSDLPGRGRLVTMPIPPTRSGFQARDAIVYLPPAYSSNPRPRLPVLVLLAGQPGSPSDWLHSGAMPSTMDAFAASHRGVTPVVIVADGTGTRWANPACVDSPAGNVSTYLTADLRAWADHELTVARDRRGWAVGGLSYGGTCAMQLVTNHPDVYSVFLNMSGQLEPTIGSRRRTVNTLFGGNEEAFRRVNPMDIMAVRAFPETSGAFVVGADDSEYRPDLERVYASAKRSGMQVELTTLPGGHSFAVWRAGLADRLPWIAAHLGIG